MGATRVCLIHGAATTSQVWAQVVAALPAEYSIRCPDRPSTGDLDTEIDALADAVDGAIVVGVSGGATLCLELAARGLPLRVALAHEPVVGSLMPELLAPIAAAFITGGVDAFATTLYGPSWTPAMAPRDPDAVARDLRMFRKFEPRPPLALLITSVGANSPPIRHEAARRLAQRYDLPVRTLPGVAHAVHLDNPAMLAKQIRQLARDF